MIVNVPALLTGAPEEVTPPTVTGDPTVPVPSGVPSPLVSYIYPVTEKGFPCGSLSLANKVLLTVTPPNTLFSSLLAITLLATPGNGLTVIRKLAVSTAIFILLSRIE